MNSKRTILCLFSIVFSLSACEKSDRNIENKNNLSQPEIKQPQLENEISISAFPDNCDSVESAIQSLKAQYSAEGLLQLNQLFKKCLGSVPIETRYTWFKASEDIYSQLFKQSSAQVYQYLTDTYEQGIDLTATQKKALYQKFKPDEKYMVEHAKELYLDKFYVGEGEYTVVQHPQYYIDIFVPQLEKADQAYLKQMRKEYLGHTYILDAGLSISFDQVANRLLAWEQLKKTYPASHFKLEIQSQIDQYRSALFKGDDNTLTLWFDENKIADIEAMKAIQKVASSESASQKTAEVFIRLVSSSEPLWQQMPKPSTEDDDYDTQEQQTIRQQRERFIKGINQSVDEILEKTEN